MVLNQLYQQNQVNYDFDTPHLNQYIIHITISGALSLSIYEHAREGKWAFGLRTYANSKASGKPAHLRSLARSFAVCLSCNIKIYCLWKQTAKLHDQDREQMCQGHLKLCCLHMSKGPFSHKMACSDRGLISFCEQVFARQTDNSQIYCTQCIPYTDQGLALLHYSSVTFLKYLVEMT